MFIKHKSGPGVLRERSLPRGSLALDIADKYDLVIILRWDYTESPNQVSSLVDLPKGIAHEVLNSPLLKEALRTAEEVEYIAWYLESAVPYLKFLANTLWSQNASCHLTLSFQPDAFLSAYYLKETVNQFTEVLSGGSWSYGPAYLFFAENEVSRRIVSWTQLRVVSRDAYLRVLGLFVNNKMTTAAQNLRDHLSTKQFKDVVFVPIRPWCTTFHDGNYDFGSGPDTLSYIYDTIISGLDADANGQTLIVVRGDYRHEAFQRAVIRRLSKRFGPQFLDLTDEIPPEITLELFMYSLFGIGNDNSALEVSLTMVSLDSSTPFPVAALGLPFRFIIGASNKVLADAGASGIQLLYINNMTMRTLVFLQYLAAELPHLEFHHYDVDGLVTVTFASVASVSP